MTEGCNAAPQGFDDDNVTIQVLPLRPVALPRLIHGCRRIVKSFNDVRIGPKLLLAFALILAFAGVIGFVAVSRLSKVADGADRIASEALGSVYRVSAIAGNAARSRSAALEVLTQLQLHFEGGSDQSTRELSEVDKQMQDNIAAYQKLISTPEQRQLSDDVSATWRDYKKEQDRSIAVAQDGLAGDAQKILIGLQRSNSTKWTLRCAS